MATTSKRMRWLIVVVPVVLVATAAALSAADKPNGNSKPKSSVLVTISKETTYITEPLRPDGYPDYLAALNQQLSKGVTPENNSAVLFWKAMGPPFCNNHPFNTKFFEMLGMPALPEKGDYFIELDRYVEGLAVDELPSDPVFRRDPTNYAWNEQEKALCRPWSQKEFPILAGWLTANKKPLALVVESSLRPRYFSPLIADPKEPDTSPLSQALGRDIIISHLAARNEDPHSQVARALTARAMLKLKEGELNEAWEDLLACHRLARLVGQGPSLDAPLIAASVDGLACAGDQALLQHARLSASQIAKMRSDLAKLAPMPNMAEKMNLGERYLFLDNVTTVARNAPAIIRKLLANSQHPQLRIIINDLTNRKLDWDLVLKTGNSWFDRVVDAYRKPTRPERMRAISKIEADLVKLRETTAATVDKGEALASSVMRFLKEAPSQWASQACVCLWMPWVGVEKCYVYVPLRFEMTRLAFALAAYRADHGSYPEKLAELVPKYLKAVPKDIFGDNADLQYVRQGDGYLLRSFGPNGKDNGGKGLDDRANNPDWHGQDWDDLVVRMSGKAE